MSKPIIWLDPAKHSQGGQSNVNELMQISVSLNIASTEIRRREGKDSEEVNQEKKAVMYYV